MNKLEEKIKEAIEKSMDQSGCSLPTKAIEGIASEKAQELIKDLAVSSPDQLEVRVDGERQGKFDGYMHDGENKKIVGWKNKNGKGFVREANYLIQLITPYGVVVMDNKKDEK